MRLFTFRHYQLCHTILICFCLKVGGVKCINGYYNKQLNTNQNQQKRISSAYFERDIVIIRVISAMTTDIHRCEYKC